MILGELNYAFWCSDLRKQVCDLEGEKNYTFCRSDLRKLRSVTRPSWITGPWWRGDGDGKVKA